MSNGMRCMAVVLFLAAALLAADEVTPRQGGLLPCEALPHRAVSMAGPKATHVVPRADGGATALLFCPREEDGKNVTSLVYVNLDTGATRVEQLPPGIGNPWSSAWGPDGRLYFGLWGPATLLRYDPETDKLESFGVIETGDKSVPHLTVGTDEKVYALTGSEGHVFSFDPATGQTVLYGRQGPKREYPIAYNGSIGVDDDFIYTTFGNVDRETWTLAMNKKTREVARLDDIRGARFRQDRLGVTAVHANKTYWMVQGKPVLQQAKDEKPPWPERPLAQRTPAPKPKDQAEWLPNSTQAQPDGTVTLWYRLAKQAPWRSLTYKLPPDYLTLSRCGALPDGRVFSTVIGYDAMCLYDPRTDAFEQLGRLPLSHRSFLVLDDKVLLAGYSGASLFLWDPAKPWTIEKGTPDRPAPRPNSPESNPRQLNAWARDGNFQFPLFLVPAADGALYAAIHGERHNVGSVISWRRPAADEDPAKPPFSSDMGFLREPFEIYDAAGLCTALDGSKLVYSTFGVKGVKGEPRPEAGRIFVIDVATRKVEWSLDPLPDVESAGFVQEYKPGKLILATDRRAGWDYDRWKGEFKGSVLYTVDMETRQVVKRVDLAGQLGNRRDYFWLMSFSKGADGMIYSFYEDQLVRIDPETLRITAVSKVGKPGFIAFSGKDAYISGDVALRRVRNALGD